MRIDFKPSYQSNNIAIGPIMHPVIINRVWSEWRGSINKLDGLDKLYHHASPIIRIDETSTAANLSIDTSFLMLGRGYSLWSGNSLGLLKGGSEIFHRMTGKVYPR
jgi:hypothetical protein